MCLHRLRCVLQLMGLVLRLRTEAVTVTRLAVVVSHRSIAVVASHRRMAIVLHSQIATVMESAVSAPGSAAGACQGVCGRHRLGVGYGRVVHTVVRNWAAGLALHLALGNVAGSGLEEARIGAGLRSVEADSVVAVAVAPVERTEEGDTTGLPVEAQRTAADPEVLGLSCVRHVEAGLCFSWRSAYRVHLVQAVLFFISDSHGLLISRATYVDKSYHRLVVGFRDIQTYLPRYLNGYGASYTHVALSQFERDSQNN